VKWRTKRGWAASHFLIAGVLCVEALSRIRCTSSSAGTSRSSRPEELLELDRAMASVQRSDHPARADVERGVETRGARALVVVRRALGRARQHRQHRRAAIERLDLRLDVDTQHHRALGRVEIEPDDVAHLVDELRIARELPRLGAVRLQPERPPDSRHRRLRQPDLAGHRARRPARRVAGRGLESPKITSSTCASPIFRGRPGRGSSTSPSSRSPATASATSPPSRA
jgi:hypothetical protein